MVVGSRVPLVDHLDRSNKCLLRGRSGVVTGWVVDPREPDHDEAGDIWLKYPVQAVMVQFEGANWQLDGMPSPGTYPIMAAKKAWHVDSKRKRPVLRVSSTQVPIGPDYVCTAYSSQGLTLDAAIVDLLFSECTNPATAYVALSRVRSTNDILIMQAFKRVLFTKGIPVGPRLLLKKLRKEDIADGLQEHIQVTCKQYLALVVSMFCSPGTTCSAFAGC